MYVGWVFAFLTGIGLPLFANFLSRIFNSFSAGVSPTQMLHRIQIVFFVMIGVGAAIGLCGFIYWSILLKFSNIVARRTKETYLGAILKQETGWFDSFNYNELTARITKETMQINKAIGEKVGLIIFSIGMTMSGFVIGVVNGWSLALVMVAIGPLIGVCAVTFGMMGQNKHAKSLKAYAQSGGYAEQCLSAIRVVVAFGMEKVEIQNYSNYLSLSKEIGRKQHFWLALAVGTFIGSIYSCYCYAFFMGSVWIQKNFYNDILGRPYQGGDILAVFWGILFGFFALSAISPHVNAVNEGKVAGKFTFDVIERQPLINQDSNLGKEIDVQGEIKFEKVGFYYPSRADNTVLNQFSCTFEKGKTTAIVGPSGSGKSTIVQLLLRFYDPTEGQIIVDGERLDQLKLRAFRKQVGYVSQEPVLFNCSIRENILLGCPTATEQDIIDALKMTNAWEFVSKYPQQLDTNVGASGGQLSGGQKQRIALARAIIKKPRILIFDEATSALDKRNEAEVQLAIDEMRKKLGSITTITIAHRLSTIKEADRIIVMKKGSIIEDGNHKSLLKDHPNGTYAKLVSQ
jgi:ATP-binding cassette, subfamily B (MDR/TAP), member 1